MLQNDLEPNVKKVVLQDNHLAQLVFGEQGKHLKIIEDILHAKTSVRGNTVLIQGNSENSEKTSRLIEQLYVLARDGFPLFPSDITHATQMINQNAEVVLRDYFLDTVIISTRKRPIVPRSAGQKRYVESIRKFDIVFGIGPAGTGKTYLAMAMAVGALLKKEVSRIVLTRPAVEAGEKLGFLPGDLAEKVNPYLRPLYDALNDMVEFDKASRLIEKGVIEVAPLAFMRGRTLNDAFVILDEAQNTTPEQMKMFLTRLGLGSKAVITGDITQTDLPANRISGLIHARDILSNIERISFIQFSRQDVVRHPLVQEVIQAYETWEHKRDPNYTY